jgi:hypothetical protein
VIKSAVNALWFLTGSVANAITQGGGKGVGAENESGAERTHSKTWRSCEAVFFYA